MSRMTDTQATFNTSARALGDAANALLASFGGDTPEWLRGEAKRLAHALEAFEAADIASMVETHNYTPESAAYQIRSRILSREPGTYGADNRPGEFVRMRDNSLWFHPYSGGAPVRL